MSPITRALLAAALLALALPAGASAAPSLVPVGTFAAPMYVTSPPGDATRLFVVERSGVIRVVRDGTKLATPFLDISSEVNTDGERGLLSMAFAPDYATSGRFYVYLAAQPDGQLQVREYRRSANPDVATPSGRRVWFADHPGEDNHNGGTIAFGRDGNLWIATGDGGGRTTSTRTRRTPRGRSASSCGSTRAARTRTSTRSPPGARSALPCGRSGCATRSAGRSTSSPATSRSATSAAARRRRSTSGRGRTSAAA